MSLKKEARFITPVNSKGDKGVSTLSKKRYMELGEKVSSILREKEDAEAVMKAVCEVMKFDPSVSRYSEEVRETLVESTRKWRQKKKAARAAAAAASAVAVAVAVEENNLT
jgi:hypothetical protein